MRYGNTPLVSVVKHSNPSTSQTHESAHAKRHTWHKFKTLSLDDGGFSIDYNIIIIISKML